LKNKIKKIKPLVKAASELSLGISIVVAILLGVAIGFVLVKIFNIKWLFWIGVFWGVGGAILNIYKAYKRQVESLNEYVNRDKSKQDTTID
jgi:F0F1-type ATP synthase assembly protein I